MEHSFIQYSSLLPIDEFACQQNALIPHDSANGFRLPIGCFVNKPTPSSKQHVDTHTKCTHEKTQVALLATRRGQKAGVGGLEPSTASHVSFTHFRSKRCANFVRESSLHCRVATPVVRIDCDFGLAFVWGSLGPIANVVMSIALCGFNLWQNI